MISIHINDGEGGDAVVAVTPQASPGEATSLMQVIVGASLPMLATCGGSLSCATCHVYVDERWSRLVGAPSEFELELLQCSDHYRPDQSRLSCQIATAPSLDGLHVTIAPSD